MFQKRQLGVYHKKAALKDLVKFTGKYQRWHPILVNCSPGPALQPKKDTIGSVLLCEFEEIF